MRFTSKDKTREIVAQFPAVSEIFKNVNIEFLCKENRMFKTILRLMKGIDLEKINKTLNSYGYTVIN